VTTGIGERLRALDTCVLSDAMDALGHSGVVAGLSAVWPSGRVAGPARTMRLRPLDAGEVPPHDAVHLGCRAVDAASEGDVIVVAHQGRTDSAGWGGLLSTAAARAGVVAVVVDGAIRDVDDAARAGLPVFARVTTPVSARGRTTEVAVDEPVVLAGRRVDPGDWVVADANGVVVVAQSVLPAVLERAEAMAAREEQMRRRILDGAPVSQVMDARYEAMTTSAREDPA
jgi:regulator of RNase E activity RraA